MAAASSIARWLFDEASSGTTPTEVADSQGSNNLTIDYSSGDAEWTSIGAGNGLNYTATVLTANTATAELTDISTNGNIGSSFPSGTKELSFITVCDIDIGHNSGPRLVQIGADGGDGDFAIATRPTNWLFRWSKESGGSDIVYPVPSGSYGTGVVVVAVVINSAEGTAENRIKVYYDNVLQAASSGSVTLDETVDFDVTANNMSLGNRGSLNRNINGQIYYSELFTGVLTATQVEDAYDALILDNDADWQAGTTIVTLSGQASTASQGALTVTGASTFALTGQSVATNQGTLIATGQASVALAGQQITSSQGSLVATGQAIIALAGQSATLSQGTITVIADPGAITVNLTGQLITASQGSLAVTGASILTLNGQVITAGQGTLIASASTVVSLGGQTITGLQGVIGLQTANILLLTGQQALAGQGVLAFTGDTWTLKADSVTAWTEQSDNSTTWIIQ